MSRYNSSCSVFGCLNIYKNCDLTFFGFPNVIESATLCGVLVAVCAACWKRSSAGDKPDDDCAGVYTVSADAMLNQVQDEINGPPPAYESVVEAPDVPKDCTLQEVLSEPCPRCTTTARPDCGLPSYEAAVLLKDTKL